jgi:PAS domain-containing protein
VTTPEHQKLIVKYIVNLHAKKYLKIFFTEVDKLLQTTISNSSEVPMMVLDRSMKISEVNAPFLELFGIKEKPRKGTNLMSLQHPFWAREDVRQQIRGTIVNNTPLRRKQFHLEPGKKKTKKIIIDSKIIEGPTGGDKKLFLMIDEKE